VGSHSLSSVGLRLSDPAYRKAVLASGGILGKDARVKSWRFVEKGIADCSTSLRSIDPPNHR